MPSFAVSISILALVQAATVALPAARRVPALERFRGSFWAAIPPLSIIAVVLAVGAASDTAVGLTYLALIAVPPLAAVALGWAAHGARPPLALALVPLFALAWADRRGLAGEGASVTLSALSCVTLGVLLAAVAPARLLKVGIVLMAVVDTALVVSDLLQAPNNVLNAAHPAAGLPRLQRELFGSAIMGYGDLLVAGALGALLAPQPRLQLRGALLAAILALSFNLLFLVVRELPATVPIAATLLLLELPALRLRRRVRLATRASRRGLLDPGTGGAGPQA